MRLHTCEVWARGRAAVRTRARVCTRALRAVSSRAQTRLEAQVYRSKLFGLDSESVPAAARLALVEGDALALLVEQEGGRQAGDPRAHHRHALALSPVSHACAEKK